jgi:hypothetical protein
MKKGLSVKVYQASINREIQEHTFELTITFTEFGEVLDISNPYHQLPESAQQLMFGKEAKYILWKLKDYIRLIPHKVPLIAIGLLEEDAYRAIKLALGAFKLPPDLNTAVSDEWTRAVYEVHFYGEKEDQEKLSMLANALSNDPHPGEARISYLAAHKFELLGPVLTKIVYHSSNTNIVHDAYRAMSRFPTPEHKSLLMKHFKNGKRAQYRHTILDSLQFYKSEEVYELLIARCETISQKNQTELAYLLRALSYYPTQKVKQLALKYVASEHNHLSFSAYSCLNKHGVYERHIAKVLDHSFTEKASPQQLQSIFCRYDNLRDSTLAPGLNTLMEVVVRANHQYLLKDLSRAVGRLVAKKYAPSILPDIRELLDAPRAPIRSAALIILTELSLHKSVGKYFLHEEKGGVFPLLDDQEQIVRFEALDTLYRLADIYGTKDWIPILLKEAKQSKRESSLLKCLNILSKLFGKGIFDDSIIPLYLELLHHPQHSIVIEAVRGLQFHIKEDVRIPPALEALKDHPNKKVQHYLNWPAKRKSRFSLKIKRLTAYLIAHILNYT